MNILKKIILNKLENVNYLKVILIWKRKPTYKTNCQMSEYVSCKKIAITFRDKLRYKLVKIQIDNLRNNGNFGR